LIFIDLIKNARKEVSIKHPITGEYLEVDVWYPDLNLCFEYQVSIVGNLKHPIHNLHRMTTTTYRLGTTKNHFQWFWKRIVSKRYICKKQKRNKKKKKKINEKKKKKKKFEQVRHKERYAVAAGANTHSNSLLVEWHWRKVTFIYMIYLNLLTLYLK
jgi:hypothetical protein